MSYRLTKWFAAILWAGRKRKRTPPLVRLGVRVWSWLRPHPAHSTSIRPIPELWPLHQPLIKWSARDTHTIGSAVTGLFVCGMTGSGKSNFVGFDIANSYLKAGFSFAIFCVKNDEPQFWIDLAARAGRSDDVLIFDHPDKSPLRFNWLTYEALRPGWGAGITENLVVAFAEVAEITSRREGQHGAHNSDPFWQQSVDGLVRNSIDLCLLADVPLGADVLQHVVLSAPISREQAADPKWRGKSLCWALLIKAAARDLSARQKHDLDVVADFFTRTWAEMAGRTRSIVSAAFTNMTDALSRGLLHELFGGDTNVTPDVLAQGKILIIALPLKEYGPTGTMVAAIWKGAIQRWAERRNVQESPRPVCLWMDEFQHLASKNDALFASTCRSSRVALTLLTQTVGGIQVALGGSDGGKAACDLLLANIATKVFLANGDPTTCEYASTLIGKAPRAFVNASSSYQPQDWLSRAGGFGIEPSTTAGISETMDWIVNPAHFGTLSTGASGCVEAIVIRNGQTFQGSGAVYLPVTFRRKF